MDYINNKKLPKSFVQNILNVEITDDQRILFQQAFIHTSFPTKFGKENLEKILETSEDYNRWEFLGDRVAELIFADYLFENIRDEDGTNSADFLTRTKSRMVKTESFSKYAEVYKFGKYICAISKEINIDDDDEDYVRQKTRINHSDSVMEDVFEAFIGVCYKCFGFDFTREFVTKSIELYTDWNKIMFDNNYKDKILRYYTFIGWGHPEYALLKKEEIGKNSYLFIACVLSQKPLLDERKIIQYKLNDSMKKMWILEGQNTNGYNPTGYSRYIAGIGSGKKLKDAEQEASLNALVNFKSILDY